jgi:hypothetical protein
MIPLLVGLYTSDYGLSEERLEINGKIEHTAQLTNITKINLNV